METLAEEILGMHGMMKDEWVGRSDWNDPWLSKEQRSRSLLKFRPNISVCFVSRNANELAHGFARTGRLVLFRVLIPG
ncbi:hypothetical protein ACS0TY_024943 [Phlomoides rotata]